MSERPDPYAQPTEAPSSTPAPGYAAQHYPAAPYGQRRNGLGTAALVLGIIGLVLFWTVILGFVLGVLALVFGIIGRKRANRQEASNGGSALAGAILGGLALAGSIAIIAAGAAFFEHNKSAFHNYRQCLDHAQSRQDVQSCADEFNRSVNR